MADPLNPLEDQASVQTNPEIENLFAQEPVQPAFTSEQQIDSLFSEAPAGLAQAQNLIQLRDNPQAIDFFLGTAERFKKGQLPFNQQAWEDAQSNIQRYQEESQPKILEAEQKGDWLEMAKLGTLGVGKVLGAYIQAGFGATNEEMEKAQQSLAARNFIGTITDPKQAAKALELAAVYGDDLDAGRSIVPEGQEPAMAFGTGPMTAKVGMNLAQAQEYLRDLESDRTKALGTAGLRNFAIQSGDAFLPFVSIGDVVVDENDPDQVARRAALTNKINETIQKDYGVSTLAGAAAGSVGSFITVGSGATKLLGRAAQLGEATVKVPTLLSRGATYATIGASQSFEGDPRNLSFGQRLASVFSESAILGLAEGLGNKVENSIDNAMSNYLVAKGLGEGLPEFAPVIGSAGKILGTTIGETTSEEIEAILRGQDPVEPFLQNLGVSFGVGLGLGLPGLGGAALAARRAKIYNKANTEFTNIIKSYVDGIKADPSLTEDQRQGYYEGLRTQFDTPQAVNIINATIAGASLDPTTSPESTKAVNETIDANKADVIQSLLAKAGQRITGEPTQPLPTPGLLSREFLEKGLENISSLEDMSSFLDQIISTLGRQPNPEELQSLRDLIEGTIGIDNLPSSLVAPVVITGPFDETQAEEAFAELVGMFEQGAQDISIENTPANEAKIKWLQGQGRIEGELTEDNKRFVVKNVKDGAGNWLRGTPAIEFNQDLKDQILIRAEQIGIPDMERDALEKELEKAGTDEDINEVALRFMGPDDYDLAVERDAIRKGEQVEIERPAELRLRDYNARIEALNKQLKEALPEDRPQIEQLIVQLTQMRDQELGSRQQRGEQSVADLIRKYENEFDKEEEARVKSGKLAPELERRPEVILPINNPESDRFKKFSSLKEPDPRENDINALGQVFNLNRPETVELLQSLGALDENLRPLMTPAEVAKQYIERKKAYLSGKALSGYQGFNIVDQVASAFLSEFQLQIRSGVPVISLSTLFNSRLRDFIRLARPRMRAGVGLGMALDFDKPGIRVGRVSKQQFADENDLNDDAADVVDQAIDEIDAALVEVPGAAAISPARRQEAMGIIAQQIVPEFRNSLPTEGEKLALDVIVSGAADLAAKAGAANLTADAVNALVEPVKKKLQEAVVGRFRQLAAENNLPSAEVELPAGVRVAGGIPANQRQALINRYRDMIAASLIDENEDDETRIAADVLFNSLLSENSKAAFDSFETFLNNVETDRLSQPAITAVIKNIDDFLRGSINDGLSQEEVNGYLESLNALSIPYYDAIGENPDETSPEYKNLTKNFRSKILAIFDKAEEKRNENLKPKGKTDETKTAVTEREKARRDLEAGKTKQATAPKRVPKETVPPTGTKVAGGAGRPATISGRPGVERARGQAIPKDFVEAPGQQNRTYPLNAVNTLGNQVVSRMSEEQKQDAEAAIVAMESSKNNAFYLANGPGTGKTRVLLATAKYYLDRGFNVVYLTAPDAVTPNWDNGTIGGSIQKDAELLGIPLAVRGGKGDKRQGLPIEKVPGKVLVTTYNSEYLKKVSALTDANTIVLFDEQHNGRNLYKKVQEGAATSWAVIMDEISNKAGRVLMASGTPFESPDQLFSLGRLGIFDTETPDALFNRLGFKKEYLKGGKKSYWRLADGVSYQEMQDRLEQYVDGLVKNGIVRSRSLKLDGVNVQFKDVPLDNTIVKALEDIKARYGGDQITNIAALRAMVAAQKRALEEYKVEAAARQAIDAIRRGKKPILYVGFVSEEDSKNNKVDPTSRSLEEAILRLNPDLKIARMYTGADQTKEEAMVAFNGGDANVLIATKEKGGTGIELDDKFGDESREMIILSPPVSAIQAVQLIYRVWRTDSASRPNIVFLESQAEVDQFNLDRMRAKLRLLEATVGSGFTRLQADQELDKEINPETVVTKVEEPTAEEVAQVESTVRGILGNAYQDNLITLKDAKGVTRTYLVKIAPGSEHMAAAQAGATNDSDTIILNPAKIQKAKEILGEEGFRKYFNQVLVEEMIHVETYRYFRDQGLDPTEEITAIGAGLSFETRLQIARAYYSNQGADISNTEIQEKIKNLANDNYLVAMEGIRMMAQLDLTKGVTEQVNSLDPGSIKRANARIKDLIGAEPKNVLARLGLWLNGMLDAIKGRLGLLPSAKDRLAIRDSLEDAISRLKTTANSVTKQAGAEPAAAALPVGVTPTSPRQSTKLDGYDLRIYRMIENVLEGRTKDVLGVEVADDMFKTVSTGAWLEALDTAARRGLITQQERTLFRTAAKFYTDGGRVSLPALANKALEIAEDLETAGESLPAAAFLPVSTGPTVTEQSVSEYGPYRVQISPYAGEPTTAKSEAQAVGNYVSRFLDAKGSMAFRGRVYTADEKGALMAAIRAEGYEKFARRLTPKPAAAEVIPTFEQFSSEKSNLPVPEKPVRETFRDDFGEINVTKAWEQVKETRPSVVKVPRGYLESYLPYIKTEKGMVEKANPNQPGLAEFIRNPERPEYVGIRVVDGWHRAQKALNENVDFYVYPVVSEKSSMRNAYDFAVNFDGFYPRTAPAAAAAAEPIRSTTELLNKEKNRELAYHGSTLDQIPSLLSGLRKDTNMSLDFRGQAFGAGEVILVYPKNQLSFAVKEYQEDYVLKESANVLPIAAMVDRNSFPETAARRSVYDVADEIATLPKEQADVAIELSTAIESGNRQKASQIEDDLMGNPIAAIAQRQAMRIREFQGKYYLPSGEQIPSSALPKIEPKPNAQKIIQLAREMAGAPEQTTRGVTQAQAVQEAVKSIPSNIPVWSFDIDLDTERVSNIRGERAAPAAAAAAEPQMRVSKAASNIITQFVDVIPDGPIKDKLLDYWYYQSTPREEQFAMARDYIARNGGHDVVVDHFLSGNIKTTLPLQAAIGFELARYLGGKAKTNLLAKEQLAEVMIKLSRKYGTEPGQAVDLWNALSELSDNPEAMKVTVGRQIDDAIKGRLAGYAEEEAEIKSGLVDANRRAAEKLTTSPKNAKVISALGNLIELNKKKVSVTEFEAALNDFFNSDEAKNDAIEFLGEDLAAASEAEGSDADGIRLNPKQTKALGRLIIKIIQRSDNPKAFSEDLIKQALFNVAGIKDSKNPDNVRRKIDLYFTAALDYAVRTAGAEGLRAARIREQGELPEGETPGEIEPALTRGEANQRKKESVQKLKEEAPVPVFVEGEGTVADEAIALAEAVEDAVTTANEKRQLPPRIKTALEKLIVDTKRMVRNRIKEKGGLPELFEKPKPPTAAELLQDRIRNNNLLQESIEMAKDALKETYSEEELSGLEVFLDEAFGRPFTVSDLKRALRTLSSIGGADVNVRSLIRESKGDLMTFENKLGELLTNNTNLDLAEQKQVLDYLREGMSELIAQERKAELERIKKRFERAKERKTRKVRSALDRLIEAVNLGVLSDSEVFSQMRGQLGLPELKESERNRLNKLIEDLPLYPKGMIRNKKISEMYQYVKLVSPQAWGDLIVNYQTSNLLAGVGTIGINAWSAYVSNLLNGAILGAFGTTYALLGNKTRAKAYIDAAKELNASVWVGKKPAFKAAQSVFLKGDYSNVQDALTMELGGVNLWEAILSQAEAYRAGKPGAVKPELPVKVFGQEYRIPLDSKFISSKFGALAPFIFFGRAMAAGDAINKISSKKMYEIAEATNIAAAKFKTQEEIEAEVARLLNNSPEAVRRAEAKAAAEAEEFNLTPQQQALRVEEILEQGRPDEEDVRILAEKTRDFAARATYTNNFEGWFGLLADGLTSLSAKAWPLRLFIKFLRTGSSLANEVLNFLPVVSTVRYYRGSAGMLKESKYYRPPPTPGTVEHDILLGKMTLGYIMTGMLLAVMKEAMGGEDDPYFNIHFKGPLDPAQREAFFAGGGKLRSIQIGRWRDGKPQFFSFEGFPVGMSAPLILSGAIVESVRYEKRSTAEAVVMSSITGGALAMYGILDMAALSGIRQIMSLTSPGVGQKDPKSIVSNLTKTMGNVAGGLIPGYATLRDVEQVWNGFTGAPSARPYQQNLLSTFAQSVPFASKVGDPDLNFLGGNVKTQLANTVPLIRRLTTFGVDSRDYDAGDRSPQAVSDKLMSLFASNRTSLDWDAGPLKDFAMLELMAQAKQDGIDLTPDDFYDLKRELTPEEKYEWMKRSEPLLREQLGNLIPQLETLSRPEFVMLVRQISNPIKRAVLQELLVEKNQQAILYPKAE